VLGNGAVVADGDGVGHLVTALNLILIGDLGYGEVAGVVDEVASRSTAGKEGDVLTEVRHVRPVVLQNLADGVVAGNKAAELVAALCVGLLLVELSCGVGEDDRPATEPLVGEEVELVPRYAPRRIVGEVLV
jgi:hypothetical protein